MSLRIIPYLIMNGNAADAIRFYEQALGAKVMFKQALPEPAGDLDAGQPRSEHSDEKPSQSGTRIAHATLRVGESTVMVRDASPDHPHRPGNNVTIAISTFDVDEARRMFAALQQGGQVHAPLRETPFSPAHGLLTDKFGVPFQITAQPSG